MKISTKGRYGLRAVIDIAIHGDSEPVSLSDIAVREDISVSYLEQLIAKLRRADIVTSVRGAKGGYSLAKPKRNFCWRCTKSIRRGSCTGKLLRSH